MGRNIVIDEHMGDPAGYSIGHEVDGRFLVIRLTDCVEIGRYATRVKAIAAAEADRGKQAE